MREKLQALLPIIKKNQIDELNKHFEEDDRLFEQDKEYELRRDEEAKVAVTVNRILKLNQPITIIRGHSIQNTVTMETVTIPALFTDFLINANGEEEYREILYQRYIKRLKRNSRRKKRLEYGEHCKQHHR